MSEAPRPMSLIACEHCGSVFQRHVLSRGETATCTRCATQLWRFSALGPPQWLALVATALIVFAIANAFPVASMSVQGMTQDATLLDAIAITWRQGHEIVSIMTGLAGFALPLFQLLLLAWVLLPLAAGRRAPGFSTALRLLGVLGPWCMVPVFLLGVLVSVVKLAGMASVAPGVGLGAFFILTIFLTLVGRLSPHTIWHYAEEAGVAEVHMPAVGPGEALTGCHVCGQVQAIAVPHDHSDTHGDGLDTDSPEATAAHRCIRCNAHVHFRKPDHLTRTWAFLLAAVVLYIPANVLPVMQIDSLLGDSAHTILGGVIELWQGGSWDLAAIVFVASVVVPMTKLLSLGVLAWKVQTRTGGNLRQRTRMYEIVELIGQWSMLDVFVVILLAALANFQGFMQISAGAGAAAFGMVVIVTMLAAMSFDPRRAWDYATAEDLEEAQAADPNARSSGLETPYA